MAIEEIEIEDFETGFTVGEFDDAAGETKVVDTEGGD